MPTPSTALRLRLVAAIVMGAAASAVVTTSSPGSVPAAAHPTITRTVAAVGHRDRSGVAFAAGSRAFARERWIGTAVFTRSVARNAALARANEAARIRARPTHVRRTYTGNLSGVVQCIKDHESGDYGESSHPWSGSGAYQFTPSTWRAWSARAGHGGYAYAYLAPPDVQDAVLIYTLTHGGAGNWSPRYGNDPCTVGL